MSYFDFPHTRSYDGDLGYIIKRLEELTAKYGEFMEYNQIKFAEPVNWNINTQYPAWNIVCDDNAYYIALKPVPIGVDIGNTDYWELIMPFKVDTILNPESYNPIANKTVTQRFSSMQNSISNVSSLLRTEGLNRENADDALSIRIDNNTNNISSLTGQLSNERTTRETQDTLLSRDIDSLNARVDNIAQTIVPGGTSGDAELADIRIGANGITYPNAGDAVRGQYNDLKNNIINDSINSYNMIESDINTIATLTISSNILDLNETETGKLTADGSVDSSYSAYKTTKYIRVEPSETYYIDDLYNSSQSATPTQVAFYDASFKFISVDGSTVNTPRTLNTSSATQYIRLTGYASRMSGATNTYNIVMSKTTPTAYVPYSKTATLNAISTTLGDSNTQVLSLGKSTEEFNRVNNVLGFSAVSDVTITSAGNGFVTANGSENTTAEAYRRSTKTAFNAGDLVILTCSGRSQGDMCVLAIYNTNDDILPYKTEIIPESSSVLTHYYRVVEDCDIVFSWVYANNITVKKISSDFLNRIAEGTSFNNNPLAKIDYQPSFISCFKSITCIGDSLTQGIFNTTTDETTVAIPEYSYPAFMKKHTGVDTINLGIGSMCASSQIDNDSWFYRAGLDPYNYLTADNVGDAVIIALGTNDVTEYDSFIGDVSTDIDLEDRTQNAHNSVGGYANIIQWCREMNPKCKIFCITISNVRNDFNDTTKAARAEANTKIKSIAALLDCYVIDLATYAETTLNEQTIWKSLYRNSSHNNALGYEKRARQTATYIDWIIRNNLRDFINIQFIGTDYDYNP